MTSRVPRWRPEVAYERLHLAPAVTGCVADAGHEFLEVRDVAREIADHRFELSTHPAAPFREQQIARDASGYGAQNDSEQDAIAISHNRLLSRRPPASTRPDRRSTIEDRR